MGIQNLDGEEWLVVSWATKYKVSNMGRVLGPRGWVLKPIDRGNGYLAVNIFPTKDRGILTSIHTLVLSEFVGERPDGYHGCHCDGDQSNNVLSNLRWDTVKANIADQMRHGTFVLGSRNGNSTLNEDLVRTIRMEHRPIKGHSSRNLAQKYGVSSATIKRVVNRSIWSHVQ